MWDLISTAHFSSVFCFWLTSLLLVSSQQDEINFFLNTIDARFAAPNLSCTSDKQRRFYSRKMFNIRTKGNGVKERNKQRNSSKECVLGGGICVSQNPNLCLISNLWIFITMTDPSPAHTVRTDEDVVKVFTLYLFKSHENGKRVNERLKCMNCSLRFKDIRYIIGKWIAIALTSPAYGDNQKWLLCVVCAWLMAGWWGKRIFKSINRQIEFIQSINISHFQRLFINSQPLCGVMKWSRLCIANVCNALRKSLNAKIAPQTVDKLRRKQQLKKTTNKRVRDSVHCFCVSKGLREIHRVISERN